MTDNDSTTTLKDVQDQLGVDNDPLADLEPRYEDLDADLFDLFRNRRLSGRSNHGESTRESWDRTFRYWKQHMAEEDRHYACPNEHHVDRFVELLEEGSSDPDGPEPHRPKTVRKRLRHLRNAYEFWVDKLRHPDDYDPFKDEFQALTGSGDDSNRDYPDLSLDEIRERVNSIRHVRDHAIVVTQLKLGIRVSELCNIQLQDVDIQHPELRDHYDEMGTHPKLAKERDRPRRENAIYIPSRDDRDGNKSKKDRIIPLDEETRYVLTRYLLMRPDADQPWVFLTKTNHGQMDTKDPGRAWATGFHPEHKYGEDDEQDTINTHFGRHHLTTFLNVRKEWPRQKVKYLRGDVPSGEDGREAIDKYVHPEYEDIEQNYRNDIFTLGVFER